MRISWRKIRLGCQYKAAKDSNNAYCILRCDPYGPCAWCDIKCDGGIMDLSEDIKQFKNALKRVNRRK
jgi:hypothetical protein